MKGRATKFSEAQCSSKLAQCRSKLTASLEAGPLQSPPKAPTARVNAHVAVPYPPFAIAALVVALVDVPLIVSPALRIRAPAQPTAGMQTMLLSSLLPPSVLTQGSPAALLLPGLF